MIKQSLFVFAIAFLFPSCAGNDPKIGEELFAKTSPLSIYKKAIPLSKEEFFKSGGNFKEWQDYQYHSPYAHQIGTIETFELDSLELKSIGHLTYISKFAYMEGNGKTSKFFAISLNPKLKGLANRFEKKAVHYQLSDTLWVQHYDVQVVN